MNSSLGLLFLLFLLAGKKDGERGAPAPHRARAPAPTGPHDYAPSPAPAASPSTGLPGFTNVSTRRPPPSTWIPYHPLNAEVIARAETLLADPSKTMVIEPDPHPLVANGLVRYLRVTSPPGHTSVVAARPAEQVPGTPAYKHAGKGAPVTS